MKKISRSLLICICASILSVLLFIFGTVRGGVGSGAYYYLFALVFLIVAVGSFPRWKELPRPLQICIVAPVLAVSQFIYGAMRGGVGPGAYNYFAALFFLIIAVGSFLYWLKAKLKQ